MPNLLVWSLVTPQKPLHFDPSSILLQLPEDISVGPTVAGHTPIEGCFLPTGPIDVAVKGTSAQQPERAFFWGSWSSAGHQAMAKVFQCIPIYFSMYFNVKRQVFDQFSATSKCRNCAPCFVSRIGQTLELQISAMKEGHETKRFSGQVHP